MGQGASGATGEKGEKGDNAIGPDGKISANKLRIEDGISMGGTGEFSVDFPNVVGGRFVVDNEGNIKSRGDIIMGGDNSWILHTPDDGRKTLYLAPKTGESWDWSKQTKFNADGSLDLSGPITVNGQPVGGQMGFDKFTNGNIGRFSGGWVQGDDDRWDPYIRGPGNSGHAYTEDKDGMGPDQHDNNTSNRSADIDVPAGMRSGFLFHLPWNNCRYFDIYGVLSNDEAVFIRRVNSHQDVNNGAALKIHDGGAIVAIPSVDRFKSIRIRGVMGRIHYMGIGWTKQIVASGGDSGFISSQNIIGKNLILADASSQNPDYKGWTGLNQKRRDGRWTHFDWKDNGHNDIRGNTTVDGSFNVMGEFTVNGKPVGVGVGGGDGTPGVKFIQNWGGDATKTESQIANDTGNYKALMITGNRSNDNGRRNVQVWDDLHLPGGDSQICIGNRWCIKAEGDFLVFRDTKTGGDHRYAMFPGSGSNKNL
jgi:hypothetical protein